VELAGLIGEEMLDLKKFEEVSLARARDDFHTDKAGKAYYGLALAGEVGELCNLVKKQVRVEMGGRDGGHSYAAKDITKEMIEDEFGGVMAYLILLAHDMGIDLGEATIKTFNKVSKEIGSKHFLRSERPKSIVGKCRGDFGFCDIHGYH
jgi:NTP pyrophosphatase (non-canonical NTP hydrolase)